MTEYKKIFMVAIASLVGSIICMIILGIMCYNDTPKTEIEENPAVIHDTIYISEELTDWQIFELALMEVESGNNSNALNIKSGARGIYQQTRIAVEDYNRIYKTNYSCLDVIKDTIAQKIFMGIQDYYNGDQDIEYAIKLHNSKGGELYRSCVIDMMNKILRREELRRMVYEWE